MSTASSMSRIREICSTLNRWGSRLTGLDFADERGWLSEAEQAEKGEIEQGFRPLTEEAERLWRELPATEIESYDARARLAVQRLERAGGKLDGFYLDDLRARGLATGSPTREFDFWAIWAVHQLTSSDRG